MFGAFDDGLSLLRGNVVCNLSAILSIVHKQELQVLQVVDGELEESVWKSVPSLLVGTIPNVWLWADTSELSSLSSINTSWMTPALLQKHETKTKEMKVSKTSSKKKKTKDRKQGLASS